MEEFVTSEIVKKLKEKDYPLLKVRKQNGDPIIYDLPEEHPDWQNCDAYYIPTIYQVLKWLREAKKIHVTVIAEYEDWFEYRITQLIKNTRCSGTTVYKTYDDAILAGIEYVLNNFNL